MSEYSPANSRLLTRVIIACLVMAIIIMYYRKEAQDHDPAQPYRDSAEVKIEAAEVKVAIADTLKTQADVVKVNTKKLDKILHEKATHIINLPDDSIHKRFLQRFAPGYYSNSR